MEIYGHKQAMMVAVQDRHEYTVYNMCAVALVHDTF